jgi:nucleoside-triphosphatase THEP1
MSLGKIIILTGEIGSGKSNLCLDVALKAKEGGIQLAGVLSPAVFKEGEKIGIDLINLKNWDRRNLAIRRDQKKSALETGNWSFFLESVQWGNQILKDAIPCDLLIVDELGPLEFNRGEGWTSGLAAVDSGNFIAALVVIRPSLLTIAEQRWKASRIVDVSDPQTTSLSEADLLEELLTRS